MVPTVTSSDSRSGRSSPRPTKTTWRSSRPASPNTPTSASYRDVWRDVRTDPSGCVVPGLGSRNESPGPASVTWVIRVPPFSGSTKIEIPLVWNRSSTLQSIGFWSRETISTEASNSIFFPPRSRCWLNRNFAPTSTPSPSTRSLLINAVGLIGGQARHSQG